METVKKVFEKDEDENCFFFICLNMDCLIEIFQKLKTDDLIRLGTMNSY